MSSMNTVKVVDFFFFCGHLLYQEALERLVVSHFQIVRHLKIYRYMFNMQ